MLKLRERREVVGSGRSPLSPGESGETLAFDPTDAEKLRERFIVHREPENKADLLR